MQMQAILDRISRRRDELGLSESAVAQKGGSRDLIRNWRRALEKGQDISARYDSLTAIARALQVSTDWLIHGAGPEPASAPKSKPSGMEEQATPFTLAPHPTSLDDPQAILKAIFGRAAVSPGLFRINSSLPAFELVKGDVLLADISRLPEPGELAVVVVNDDQTATSTTLICRYLPPYLVGGMTEIQVPTLRIDDPGVTVRHPVVGSIRGIPVD